MNKELKKEYRDLIVDMIDRIEDGKFLQKIYTLILLHRRKVWGVVMNYRLAIMELLDKVSSEDILKRVYKLLERLYVNSWTIWKTL